MFAMGFLKKFLIVSIIISAVECPRLITPPKASINYIGSGFGAIARYRCDPGYTLVGVSSRTCKSDGEWSGDDPVCIEGKPETPQYQCLSLSLVVVKITYGKLSCLPVDLSTMIVFY